MRVHHQILSSLFTVLIVCSSLLWLGNAPPTWAQSTNAGTVAGTVTDQSGAVVNSATVTLTDTATKTSRAGTTNDTGRYIFVDVVPGTYDLTVGKQGFSTSKTETSVLVGTATTV